MQEPFSTTALEKALEIEGAREILRSFLEDTNGVADRIANSVTKRQSEKLRSDSHMLRGCCKVLGAKEAAKISKSMELAASKGDWNSAEQHLPKLLASFDRITTYARRYLHGA